MSDELKQPDPSDKFELAVERWLPMVHASALRRLGDPSLATEVTLAVFQVFHRRRNRLGRSTSIGHWLYQITRRACRQRTGSRFSPQPSPPPIESDPLPFIGFELEASMDRLSKGHQVLLLEHAWPGGCSAISPRANEQVTLAMLQLRNELERYGRRVTADQLGSWLQARVCTSDVPAELYEAILHPVRTGNSKPAPGELARKVLRNLAWWRWTKRIAIGTPCVLLGMVSVIALLWHWSAASGHSRLMKAAVVWSVKREAQSVEGLAQTTQPWKRPASVPARNAAAVKNEADLYQSETIWEASLHFTSEAWRALQPTESAPLPHWLQPDGSALLRNPDAQRSGLAGVLGYNFDWAQAELQFGGLRFSNVAVRIKGNGTFLASLSGSKRPLKVDLDRFSKGQRMGDVDELTFNNMINDYSCLSDALGYEFFRAAGVPASRTAYSYLTIEVEGRAAPEPLGLYLLLEPVDASFASSRFESKSTPIFKPVTYELFKYLGDDWKAYSEIYDLKTKASVAQLQRVIEFSKLLTLADKDEFMRKAGEFFDLPKFARYLACEVMLSNYDSFLSNGQNFYLYLDNKTDTFGIIPWDLDLCWGGFFLLGSRSDRAQASIWRPWVGEHRLLERMFEVPEFRELYRNELERLLAGPFRTQPLFKRIDELAEVVRSPIAAESSFRLRKFEQAISDQIHKRVPGEDGQGANRPAHQLKRFIRERIKSVRDQLDGKTEGVVLHRRPIG
ncbi:MAG: hypothetical protein FJ405_05590 [Verrucomicrobia bacterium]|nr:hypothetical protein [Verrucomicrobiota bacterium]